MSRILLPWSLISVASAFQIAETHQHVDYEGMKIAMVSMAKQAEKDGINGDTVDAIRGFLDTINKTLLPALEEDRNKTQELLDTAVDAVNQCNKDKTTYVTGNHSTHDETVISAKDDHEACRGEEAETFCDYKKTCQKLEDRVCTWTVCDIPDFSAGDTDEVNTYMECLDAFFDQHRPEVGYYEDRELCINRTKTHHEKTAECDGLQLAFEQAFCSRESGIETACGTYEGCRCRKEKLWLAEQESAKDLENIFQMQFVALHHLNCYGNQILANTSINLDECDKDNDCDNYPGCPKLTYPKPDDFLPCTEPSANIPCEDAFLKVYENYGHVQPRNFEKMNWTTYDGPVDDSAVAITGECTAYTPVDDCTACANNNNREWGPRDDRKTDMASIESEHQCPL